MVLYLERCLTCIDIAVKTVFWLEAYLWYSWQKPEIPNCEIQSHLLLSRVNIHSWSRILEKFWVESKLCWSLYKAGTRHVAGGCINCLLWECFSASLSYCLAADNMNKPVTLLSEVKCRILLWWWPLPGHEPLVRAPVFIGSLVWTVVVNSGGHTDGYCRKIWGFHSDIGDDLILTGNDCVAVGNTILRNFGNCSPTVSLCRRRASSWLLCDCIQHVVATYCT